MERRYSAPNPYGARCSSSSVQTPTLVVSDIGLPQGDGYMLLRAIRSREQRDGGHVPAIAISGFPSRESGERARQAGFDVFLHKPVETSELLKIARALVAPDLKEDDSRAVRGGARGTRISPRLACPIPSA